MISTQNLAMIPPVHGRERTYAWFPPAYGQYEKVPYKTMATIDDYKYFTQAIETEIVGSDNINTSANTEECEGSVLNRKLNAIRQQLTKKRIDPVAIRQQCMMKPSCIQDFMKIPASWKPKYPEPNMDLLSVEIVSGTSTSGKEIVSTSKDGDQTEGGELRPENRAFGTVKKSLLRRPYTAPGHISKAEPRDKTTEVSAASRLHSAEVQTRSLMSASLLRQRLVQTSCSESNIHTLRYERDLEKYKWLMEIPCDPFEIKKPHLPEKQQYVYEIADIKVLPREPTMKKQNRDTFFSNSMPYQSLSFDISPNFTSEKYNRMKDRLRSQGKWNYSSKNFSFVY